MTKSKILAAAAILASALASPAMAQQVIYNPGYCAQFYPNANCQNRDREVPTPAATSVRPIAIRPIRTAPGATATTAGTITSGFWPGDVAAGVVGGAVGTAAAIATSPIGGDEYARRNGFVCVPGTWFRGEDGRRHLCQ